MLVLATTGSLFAQSVTMSDVMISSVKIKDGKNTIQVPDGKGTIQLVKRGDKFTDVVYTDAAGKESRLSPVRPGTNGAPKPPCKFPIPDACFSIPNNQSVGMCICRPTDLSSGEDYSVSLLLPAVQKVRDAATRN
ncbi:hypothetical protein D3H65_32650 [Paraflavitalea soli]|uniref:Uncharacterized protein n=2 Tax=Paraflavitalea soli TaxID=2315862 RepID=A0A3B7MZ04_9BACT|nr:hypothetical protein D3H65_32650 [Paraflavitalea soli]